MPYLGLLDLPEPPHETAATSAALADAVLVTGPQGCGNRLLCAVLEAGGFRAVLDSRHATVRYDAPRVVITARAPLDSLSSALRNFDLRDVIPPELSAANARRFYPDAHIVDYDELCAQPEPTLAALAGWLGVDPWPAPEPIHRRHHR